MGGAEDQLLPPPPLAPPPLPADSSTAPDAGDRPPQEHQSEPSPTQPPPPQPPPPFDPSRMIGIIKRKALIKQLAAVYHNECLVYCRELLELQNKSDEPFLDLKPPEETRKETMRRTKRLKKSR